MGLNTAQQEAVEYVGGPLLIVAGAGTGKTSVLTEKIAHLVTSGLAQPEEIVALTFTDKAANELTERVDARLALGYVDLSVSTFHTFCQRLIEEYGLEIGLPRNFKLVTEVESWLLLRQNIYDLQLDYYRPLGNPAKYIPELLRHFSKCKDDLITDEAYVAYAEQLPASIATEPELDEKKRLTELANAYRAYNQLLLKAGALDFGDLVFYAVKLLRERPRVRAAVAKRFKFVLVDEFQDVNWAQYELVRLLSEAAQLTVVGDDDQSIYAFRGANVSNILRFRDDFSGAKSIVLNENYRSRQEILDVAYTVIQNNNPDRLETRLEIDKKLLARRETTVTTPAVTCTIHATADDEVRAVIQELQRLKAADPTVAWSDCAILARANNHTESILRALEKAGIPYECGSSVGLFRQPIILDAYNVLRVATQSRESAAIFRLLHLPSFTFAATDIHALMAATKRKSVPLYEILAQSDKLGLTTAGQAQCVALHALLTEIIEAAKTAKPTAVLYKFLEASGYLQYLTHQEDAGDQTVVRQIQHLTKFFEFIADFENSTSNPHVAHFIEYLEALLEAGEEGALVQTNDTPDAVTVLTVHGSKGLEYRYVFVVNLVEDRFPTRRRSAGIEVPAVLTPQNVTTGDEHYQEERRLFYVAVTRAKDGLYLSAAESYGGTRAKKVSRFLVEAHLAEAPKKAKSSTALVRTIQANQTPVVPPTKSALALPKEFSFSQIADYEKCPYYYKLKHLIHIPTPGAPHFSFGQSIHLTLQRFYEALQIANSANQASLFDLPTATNYQSAEIKVPSVAELFQLYADNFISDWYENQEQRDRYFAKGRDILKKFYDSQKGQWTIPVALEDSFKIKIGNYVLRGKIDRVDQNADGTLHIIDYKTGEPKTKLTADDKEQLLIYQIATETLPAFRHLGTTSELTFYYLNNNTQVTFVGSQADLDSLKQKIETTIDQIYTGDFTATPSEFACKRCSLRAICDYRVG